MDLSTAQQRALELISESPAAVLTTIDASGWPNSRAMLNLRNEGRYPDLVPFFRPYRQDFRIFFTTNTSSEKVRQIEQNNKASIYYCSPSEWRGLMLGGTISVVSDPALKQAIWQNEWTMYYPGGVQDPDNAILCLIPGIAKYYESLDSAVWNPVSEA